MCTREDLTMKAIAGLNLEECKWNLTGEELDIKE